MSFVRFLAVEFFNLNTWKNSSENDSAACDNSITASFVIDVLDSKFNEWYAEFWYNNDGNIIGSSNWPLAVLQLIPNNEIISTVVNSVNAIDTFATYCFDSDFRLNAVKRTKHAHIAQISHFYVDKYQTHTKRAQAHKASEKNNTNESKVVELVFKIAFKSLIRSNLSWSKFWSDERRYTNEKAK